MKETPDRANGPVPEEVADPLLWREAMRIMARHRPDPDNSDGCAWAGCTDADGYPCRARRAAQKAEIASYDRGERNLRAREQLEKVRMIDAGSELRLITAPLTIIR